MSSATGRLGVQKLNWLWMDQFGCIFVSKKKWIRVNPLAPKALQLAKLSPRAGSFIHVALGKSPRTVLPVKMYGPSVGQCLNMFPLTPHLSSVAVEVV